MKFAALVLILAMLSASGWALVSTLVIISAAPASNGSEVGLWILVVMHLVAACVMTGCYIDSRK